MILILIWGVMGTRLDGWTLEEQEDNEFWI